MTNEANANDDLVSGSGANSFTYQKDQMKQLEQLRPSIELVDQLADELVAEYNNLKYRAWYCGIINQFGVEQVNEWRKSSRNGDSPARLFSHYVRSARTEDVQAAYRQARADYIESKNKTHYEATQQQSTVHTMDVAPTVDEIDNFTEKNFSDALDGLYPDDRPPVQLSDEDLRDIPF